MDNSLKIALPKGRLLDEALKFFSPIGIEFPGIKETKKLRVPSSDGAFEALIVRAADVPVYVAYGAADLGIVGKDVLWESADGEDELYELADLGFGSCKLVVAGSQDGPPKFPMWRVATKYPISTEKYFQEQGRPVEIIKLYGSVELAPLTGIADVIVDIVETGTTLKANNLRVFDELKTSSARLVANRVSYKVNSIKMRQLVEQIQEQL